MAHNRNNPTGGEPTQSDPCFSELYPYSATSHCAPGESTGYKVKQGTMQKQCPSMPLLWQERYFVLTSDNAIYYYLDVSFLLFHPATERFLTS